MLAAHGEEPGILKRGEKKPMFIQLFTVHIHNFYFIGTFCLGLRGSETGRPPIITVQARRLARPLG
jgi:hypothetical protein